MADETALVQRAVQMARVLWTNVGKLVLQLLTIVVMGLAIVVTVASLSEIGSRQNAKGRVDALSREVAGVYFETAEIPQLPAKLPDDFDPPATIAPPASAASAPTVADVEQLRRSLALARNQISASATQIYESRTELTAARLARRALVRLRSELEDIEVRGSSEDPRSVSDILRDAERTVEAIRQREPDEPPIPQMFGVPSEPLRSVSTPAKGVTDAASASGTAQTSAGGPPTHAVSASGLPPPAPTATAPGSGSVPAPSHPPLSAGLAPPTDAASTSASAGLAPRTDASSTSSTNAPTPPPGHSPTPTSNRPPPSTPSVDGPAPLTFPASWFNTLRRWRTDVLLALIVACCSVVGTLLTSLRDRKRDARFDVRTTVVGLASGFVAFIALRGGKTVFLMEASGEVPTFNAYAMALTGLLVGLFTARAYELLATLVDDLIGRIRGAIASKHEGNGGGDDVKPEGGEGE